MQTATEFSTLNSNRSDRNQLRLYEKIDGEAHHEAIVKEYSRSSADQVIFEFKINSTLFL
jgi:hypothetical protein